MRRVQERVGMGNLGEIRKSGETRQECKRQEAGGSNRKSVDNKTCKEIV